MEQADQTKVNEAFDRIYSEYKNKASGEFYSCLVIGVAGAGKTSFVATAPRPILIDSFDPRGTFVLREQIEKKEVYVRQYWDENSKKPSQYAKWESQWEKDIASGFLENFATYSIDSATTFINAMTNEVARRFGRTNNLPAIQDYMLMYNLVRDMVKITSTRRVNFILTGHSVFVQDELSGEITVELDTYKKLKSQIPLLFTEKYVIVVKQTGGKARRVLLTAPQGRYMASTQLGSGGKFNTEEEPDLRNLLKKAGLPYEDKK